MPTTAVSRTHCSKATAPGKIHVNYAPACAAPATGEAVGVSSDATMYKLSLANYRLQLK